MKKTILDMIYKIYRIILSLSLNSTAKFGFINEAKFSGRRMAFSLAWGLAQKKKAQSFKIAPLIDDQLLTFLRTRSLIYRSDQLLPYRLPETCLPAYPEPGGRVSCAG